MSDKLTSEQIDENDEMPALKRFIDYVKERGWNTDNAMLPELAAYVRFHDEEVDKMWLWFSTGWKLATHHTSQTLKE